MASDFNVFDSSSLVDLGNDLVIDENSNGGDIVVSPFGDLTPINQVDNLKKAIKRRLFTPKGSLGIYVQDINGLYYIDGDYGNEAYRYLSEPLTNELLDNMRDALIECLGQEPRISLSDVVPSIQSGADGIVTVDFIASYTIISNNVADNVVINFDPNTGNLS